MSKTRSEGWQLEQQEQKAEAGAGAAASGGEAVVGLVEKDAVDDDDVGGDNSGGGSGCRWSWIVGQRVAKWVERWWEVSVVMGLFVGGCVFLHPCHGVTFL